MARKFGRNYELCVGWRAQRLAGLTDVFGPTHVYASEFAMHTQHSGSVSSAECGLGVLLAAKDDIEHGYLT